VSSILPSGPDDNSTPRRKAISKRVRFEVLARDNYTCRYCRATDVPLTIDHVKPVALGGTDDPSNLVAACKDCNAGKSSRNPDAETVAQVSDDAVRWSAAVRVAAERAEARAVEQHELLNPWFEFWEARSRMGWSYHLPGNVRHSLARLMAAGATVPLLIDAADVALAAPNVEARFRYFIGVANNMLATLHDEAQEILSEQEQPKTGGQFDPGWAKGFDDAFRVPLVWESWIQARALSQVVDGPYWWNTKREAIV
jgi:hypothetical protein